MTIQSASEGRRFPWKWVAVTLFLIGVGVICFFLYTAHVSLQVEERLQTTLYSIRLVERFVKVNNRWPHSWQELETITIPAGIPTTTYGENTSDWPHDTAYLQRFVIIDFNADPNRIANQTVKDFTAIRPNGICYPYKDYGFIFFLQRTLIDKGFGGKGQRK